MSHLPDSNSSTDSGRSVAAPGHVRGDTVSKPGPHAFWDQQPAGRFGSATCIFRAGDTHRTEARAAPIAEPAASRRGRRQTNARTEPCGGPEKSQGVPRRETS